MDNPSNPHEEVGALSPAEVGQRVEAGKGRYAQMVRQALERYPTDPDKAARWLTGQRKNHGFRHNRGITRAYMEAWARRLGPTQREEG